MNLTDMQKEIIDFQGNLIVQASAGTGKTHTMVAKIEKDIEDNENHKVVAAITFTIKAANEIKDRLSIDSRRHFIGTNNSFAIEEIIKPFMKDIYGESFDKDMGTDYSHKTFSYQEGIKKILDNGVLSSYDDNTQNFIFQLAYEIMLNSYVCRTYLKSKYFKIYIDEYQDCDKDMHKLFMYIADELKIDTFVVGDEKQSIYIWRGAYPEAFKSIQEKNNFSKLTLRENFRSSQEIQNFTNLLSEDTRDLYEEIEKPKDIVFLETNNETYNWVEEVKEYLNVNSNFAVLRYSNKNAKDAAMLMQELEVDCVYIPRLPISEITTDSAWLYMSIAQFCIFDHFSVYDFLYDIPVESEESTYEINLLRNNLESIKESIIKEDGDFVNNVISFARYLDYNVDVKDIELLSETITNEDLHVAFEPEKYNQVAITFHSSKGLEFEQVIIFAEDYSLDDIESINNLYVASSRAEKKLIIIKTNHWAANKFENNLNELFNDYEIDITDIIKFP